MPEGDVEPRDVRLSQQGEIRLAPDAPWRPFRATQWMSGSSIDFRWRAWFRMARFAPVQVADSFESGAGALSVKAFGLFPIAGGRGPDFDRGEAVRGLAELPWRPFAFGRLANVKWEAAGENRLMLTFDDGRTRASVELEADREGRIVGGSAIRPRAKGKSTVETKWSGYSATIALFAASASRPRPRSVGFSPRDPSRIGGAASRSFNGDRRGRIFGRSACRMRRRVQSVRRAARFRGWVWTKIKTARLPGAAAAAT